MLSKIKTNKNLYIIILLVIILFSCKGKQEGLVIAEEDGGVKYEVLLRDKENFRKDSVNLDFSFCKTNDEIAIVTINNNSNRGIVINRFVCFNDVLVVEIHDMNGNKAGTIPPVPPPVDFSIYDTIIPPHKNIRYGVETFRTSVVEKDKGEIFVEIQYRFENEEKKKTIQSNHLYYEKRKLITK